MPDKRTQPRGEWSYRRFRLGLIHQGTNFNRVYQEARPLLEPLWEEAGAIFPGRSNLRVRIMQTSQGPPLTGGRELAYALAAFFTSRAGLEVDYVWPVLKKRRRKEPF